MTIEHRDLAAGRWWTLSLAEQLGNIVRVSALHELLEHLLCDADVDHALLQLLAVVPLGAVGNLVAYVQTQGGLA